MTYREHNRVVLFSFLMCGAAIVALTWTISTKFIGNTLIALAVNIGVGLVVAYLFERYLESRMNRSVDALILKLGRVRQGDLTQRFKEEPDDTLPYGLSLELGRVMDFLRDKMGMLWKTSATLIRQLGQLIESSQEALSEFRSEVEYLSSIGQNLESVRNDISTISKTVSDLQVSSANDIAAIASANQATMSSVADVQMRQNVMTTMIGTVNDLEALSASFSGFIADVTAVSRKVEVVGKSIAELSNQSGLIKLNASIDASQEVVSRDNYVKLVAEIERMLEKISSITQESIDASSFADARIADLNDRLVKGSVRITKGRTATDQADRLLHTVAAHFVETASIFGNAVDGAQSLRDAITKTDQSATTITIAIRDSVTRFDRLRADTQITLLKFGALETKIESIRETLKKLEEFKNLFQIA